MSCCTSTDLPLILGSRSPRRLDLLSLLIPQRRIHVAAPQDESEAGFEGKTSLAEILSQLAAIARTKNEAVYRQSSGRDWGGILTADTVVIAVDPADRLAVLGKPDGPHWKETTRDWFLNYYDNRAHQVATGVCLRSPEGTLLEFQVLTQIRFGTISPEMIDWYIHTGEPLGKAGGYGLQGAADMFVKSIIGSPSNVIGLPLEQTWQALQSLSLL
ncbi:Maf family protein [Planctomicrobium sp. SH661]|uniref:Maf family protein n=1 Tax=Planctomicrobium sp. SH661 TaxID=3448124 RepID=UPI003F5BB205